MTETNQEQREDAIRERERALIVAWLRKSNYAEWRMAAARIERGEHEQ